MSSPLMKRHKKMAGRYIAVMCIFGLICVAFLARLINFGIVSNDKYAPTGADDGSVERIYIHAIRGNICDRNGNILVSNNQSYSLALDYITTPNSKQELNHVIMEALYALDTAGKDSVMSESLCPFEGTFPNISFCDEFTENPIMYNEFIRLLEENFVTSKHPLEEIMAENSAFDIARYYARKNGIVKEHKDKNGDISFESDFTNEEITRLIEVRYEMNRRGFDPDHKFILADKITYDFNVYIKEMALPGLCVIEETERTYLYPGYASHILGLTGPIYKEDWPEYKDKGYDMGDQVGISGCEQAFEDYLRGVSGIVEVHKDKNGIVTETEVLRKPIAGKDVWLTIDIDLQKAAEDSLFSNIQWIKENAQYEHTGEDASAGAAVAMDPKNGEILALASYPSYDLSHYNSEYDQLSKNPNAPLLNRALQSVYAPGSTFKIGIALAGLETETITPYSTYRCDGYYWRYGRTDAFKCAVYPGMHGDINVSRAIEVSCNCFFYETGHHLGIDTMNDWCKLYGLGEHTGIELSEKTGILAGERFREENPDFCKANGLGPWQKGDTWQAAIGQSENAFTPLQVNCYINSIINGGNRFAAHLLHSVHKFDETENEKAVYIEVSKILDTIPIKRENLILIRNAMESVISGDEAAWNVKQHFKDLAYTVGGKSGTAQAGTSHSNNAWFTAFAPVEDPEITVTCMIEHGAFGGNSAYTVRKIMDAYFQKG